MTVTFTIAAISIGVALVMLSITLRVILQERRRSAARVAALQADIYQTEDEDLVVLHDPPAIHQGSALAFETAAAWPGRVPVAPLVAVAAAIVIGMIVGTVRYRANASDER